MRTHPYQCLVSDGDILRATAAVLSLTETAPARAAVAARAVADAVHRVRSAYAPLDNARRLARWAAARAAHDQHRADYPGCVLGLLRCRNMGCHCYELTPNEVFVRARAAALMRSGPC